MKPHEAIQILRTLNRGERFRAARMAKGWSQMQVSIKTGISRSTIESIELCGDRYNLTYDKGLVLAKAYDVPLRWLMEGR